MLAATNKIENIDSSLLRSGRFDLLLETVTPDNSVIKEILDLKIKSKGVTIPDISKIKLKDFNGADIDTMINLAIQFSNSKNLTNKGVQKAIDEIDKRKKIASS